MVVEHGFVIVTRWGNNSVPKGTFTCETQSEFYKDSEEAYEKKADICLSRPAYEAQGRDFPVQAWVARAVRIDRRVYVGAY